MRKTITLLIIIILLFSTQSLATTNYTELELHSITIETDDAGYQIEGFTSFDLINPLTERINSFNYHDAIDTIPNYLTASYYYDYDNDLLLIIASDGTILFNDLGL